MKVIALSIIAAAAVSSPVAAQTFYQAPQGYQQQYAPQQAPTSCQGTINSGVAGATLGAALGGNNNGNKLGGALLGALVGAATNHVVCDRQQQQYSQPQRQQYAPQPVYQPVQQQQYYAPQPECGMGVVIVRHPDGTTQQLDVRMCMTNQGWKAVTQ